MFCAGTGSYIPGPPCSNRRFLSCIEAGITGSSSFSAFPARAHLLMKGFLPMARFVLHPAVRVLRMCALLVFAAVIACRGAAQSKPASDADVLVLSNGDTLHGKFVNEVGGKVTFHSDPLGDVSVPWEKIKELHSAQKLA